MLYLLYHISIYLSFFFWFINIILGMYVEVHFSNISTCISLMVFVYCPFVLKCVYTYVTHMYLKCALNFNKYIRLYHYPRKFPYACSTQFLFSLPKAIFIFLRRLILPFLEFHSSGFLHYIHVCLTFTEHAFEHIVICISSLFYC